MASPDASGGVGKEPVTIRAISFDEEGRKRVSKLEVEAHGPDTLRHIEKKLVEKGVHTMDRHPVKGWGKQAPPKGGRGGKYTWEGPRGVVESAMVEEGDPNYGENEDEGVEGVVGEVEVAKVAAMEGRVGVGRVEVNPRLDV